MPIKAENKHRYPADWPQVRERILQRARYRCEHVDAQGNRCRACQYSVGWWLRSEGAAWLWKPVVGNTPATTAQDHAFFRAGRGFHPQTGPWTCRDARAFVGTWCWDGDIAPTVIVLTIGHLDHQPENCDPANLACWCQRHHLAHDQQYHLMNAWRTRRAAAGTGELFEVETERERGAAWH